MRRTGYPLRGRRLSATVVATLVLAAVLAACHGGPHVELLVTTGLDGPDLVPGDGVCEMTAGVGDCSLRAAIDEWAGMAGAVGLIDVPSGAYVLTEAGVDDANAVGDLDIDATAGELTIRGGSGGVSLDAAGAEQGIEHHGGPLTLDGIGVTGASGAGVVAAAGADLTMVGVAVHANGGSGLRIDAGGTVDALHSTMSENGTGGVDNGGDFVGQYVTITANTGGGLSGASAATLGASIVADQATGPDCDGTVASADFNLDSDGTCGLGGPSDLVGAAAGLDALGGGLVPGHAPGVGSPALESVAPGSAGCGGFLGTFDQLGSSRPLGTACDRGAVEANLVVNGDAETGTADPWTEVEGSGLVAVPAPPGNGGFAFHPETTPVVAVLQGVTITEGLALVDSGTAVTSAGGVGHQTVGAAVTVTFWDATFSTIGSSSAAVPGEPSAFGTGDVVVPAGTRYLTVGVGWEDLTEASDDWVDDLYLVPPH